MNNQQLIVISNESFMKTSQFPLKSIRNSIYYLRRTSFETCMDIVLFNYNLCLKYSMYQSLKLFIIQITIHF